MTAEPVTACPPGHTAYPSEQIARNAVELHRWAFRYCGGYGCWPCGDHWHAGHVQRHIGDACKRNPTHLAAKKRIRNAHKIGRWS